MSSVNKSLPESGYLPFGHFKAFDVMLRQIPGERAWDERNCFIVVRMLFVAVREGGRPKHLLLHVELNQPPIQLEVDDIGVSQAQERELWPKEKPVGANTSSSSRDLCAVQDGDILPSHLLEAAQSAHLDGEIRRRKTLLTMRAAADDADDGNELNHGGADEAGVTSWVGLRLVNAPRMMRIQCVR